MEFSNRLNLSQGLKQELGLKLTPEMRLRLDVLQATHLELRDILNKEVSENPLLDDFVDDDDEPVTRSETAEKSEKTEDLTRGAEETHLDELDSGSYENLFDAEYDNRSAPAEYNPEMGKFEDYKYNSMSYEEKPDLGAELTRQANEAGLNDEAYLSVASLISSLDEKGFLVKSLDEIASETAISAEALSKALEMLKTFEPAGVGASDARECLLIQLKQRGQKDTLAYNIIDREFALLSKQNYHKLASVFRVKEDDIKKAKDVIKELSPFPAVNFAKGTNEYVVPDIVVTEEEGAYKVHVPSNFPEVKINRKYLSMYKEKKETRDFIKAYEERVKALLKALEERNKTIENVIKKIITYQEGFLKSEEAGLIPLTYKEIAQESGISESTVSRIVSKKYIQLPTGVYPMKKFFMAGIETSNGGGPMANAVIRDKILNLIGGEDLTNPLTDTDLEKILKERGIPVARRTVTKYREQLGLLPANMRKKQV
jgi:RNA polymerase sigma-54 factor